MTAKVTVLRGYNLLASERDTVRGVQVRTSAVYILASERSERDTLRGNAIEISLYLLASERSERDTLSRSSMKNAIRIYIYIYIGT